MAESPTPSQARLPPEAAFVTALRSSCVIFSPASVKKTLVSWSRIEPAEANDGAPVVDWVDQDEPATL